VLSRPLQNAFEKTLTVFVFEKALVASGATSFAVQIDEKLPCL
jgi:hypothetical protein